MPKDVSKLEPIGARERVVEIQPLFDVLAELGPDRFVVSAVAMSQETARQVAMDMNTAAIDQGLTVRFTTARFSERPMLGGGW